jgi:outer membrane protein assembly factor BamB
MPRTPGRLAVLVLLALLSPAAAGDWPAWRYDAQRSAAAPDDLPTNLRHHWTLALPNLTPAWPDQPLMPFDAAYEPVVAGHLMFVGSSRTDSVTAYDTRTGEQRWRFLADGPVRFAPLWHAGKLYFACDDGHLYCLDAATGELNWKVRGGPSDRHILGNSRLISTWPARGAPVIADGTVYFAASIWPFMGIFIHAVDAETGKTVWTNDGDGSLYIKQPHAADSFAGVAPQGPMAIAGDLLLVPGGRSVPAAYDRRTGKLRHFLLNENSKKGGGHTVAVAGDIFFNGPGAFLTATGKYLGDGSPLAVAAGGVAYVLQSGEVRALDLKTAERKGPRWKVKTTGAADVKDATTLIKAGSRLYVGRPGKVAALALPLPRETEEDTDFAWEAPVEGTPVSLIAADDRLFVSTKEGRIYCFGPGEPAPHVGDLGPSAPALLAAHRGPTPPARQVVEATRVTEGYAVVWSADAGFLTDLIRRTRLHVIAIDPDPARVRAARGALIAADLYGERCAVHHGDPRTFALPPYMTSLMVAPAVPADALGQIYEALRPYGGTLFLTNRQQDRLRQAVAGLPNAVVKSVEGGVLLVRDGPLPGSADWTHEHADAANTRVSKDSLVKAPLGVLWFGGTTNEGILPRHGHGPQPQVVGGRIIIEGADLLRALDAYTGRLLWEAPLPGLGDFYNNVLHQPGANARGTNYISLPDGIYVAYKAHCLRLDPDTGRQLAAFTFPSIAGEPGRPQWGHINVVGDYLIGAADPKFTAEAERQAKSVSKLLKFSQNDIFAASRYLAVLDRHTGRPLWMAKARLGFRHNTICAGGGKLFAIDRVFDPRRAKPGADGEDPRPACVIAWDLATGKELWHDEDGTFGTWLSYSEKFDVLVESGRVTRDTLSDEPVGMRAYRGSDGKELWYDRKAVGPAMLHDDTVLRGQGACDLLTGKPRTRRDPITGEEEEWTWARNYGCNTPAASEHLLTFRSGAAGFYDLCHDGGTGNFGGFRSSCTNNLIVADGILAAPDYTRTCTCSYQNQCSLALVPMPDAEEWTFYGKATPEKVVRRAGINFGAPGDRRAADGTLWLEFPSTGGASPAVPVVVTGRHVEYFRKHQSSVAGELPWVAASGVRGVEGVAIKVLPGESAARYYTVRLFFAEPDDVKRGERVFGVTVQGRRVLDDLDIVKEAGRPLKAVVKEVRGVRVNNELRLSFRPTGKLPAVLCGVEVIEE